MPCLRSISSVQPSLSDGTVRSIAVCPSSGPIDVRIVSSAWDGLALTLRWRFLSNTWARMLSTVFEIKCPLFYQMMELTHTISRLPGGWGRRSVDRVAFCCVQRSFVLPILLPRYFCRIASILYTLASLFGNSIALAGGKTSVIQPFEVVLSCRSGGGRKQGVPSFKVLR